MQQRNEWYWSFLKLHRQTEHFENSTTFLDAQLTLLPAEVEVRAKATVSADCSKRPLTCTAGSKREAVEDVEEDTSAAGRPVCQSDIVTLVVFAVEGAIDIKASGVLVES